MTLYEENAPDLLPGDVIVVGENAFTNPLAALVKLFTGGGPTHSAIVRQPARPGRDVMIMESKRDYIERPGSVNGVRTGSLLPVVEYHEWAAALQLDRTRPFSLFRFYEWAGKCDGHVGYDMEGLFAFLGRDIPVLGKWHWQDQRYDRMICSAFVASCLVRAGVLRGINWSKVTPQDLVELGIYCNWLPLKGTPKLKRYNTL